MISSNHRSVFPIKAPNLFPLHFSQMHESTRDVRINYNHKNIIKQFTNKRLLWLQSRQISQTCRFDRKEGSPAASLTAKRRHPVEKRWNMCRVFPSLRSGNIIFSLSSLKVTHTLTFKRILVNNRFPRQPFIYLLKKK